MFMQSVKDSSIFLCINAKLYADKGSWEEYIQIQRLRKWSAEKGFGKILRRIFAQVLLYGLNEEQLIIRQHKHVNKQ